MNPGPGLGLARSAREAFPAARIVGLEYAQNIPSYASTELDHVLHVGSWSELDLDRHGEWVKEQLAAGTRILPGSDPEVFLYHELGIDHEHLYIPPATVRTLVRKPCAQIASIIGFSIPPTISCSEPDEALHAFGRLHGWRLWVKGLWYDAHRVRNWAELVRAVDFLASVWGSDTEFLCQADIEGVERAILFCARKGRLLDALEMEKREKTPQGKAWTGIISDLDSGLYARLQQFVEQAQWHGGGEIEYIADARGTPYLLECNARFPAWIHGSTVCGRNLVRSLLEGRTTELREIPHERSTVGAFSRVVTEVPLHFAEVSP